MEDDPNFLEIEDDLNLFENGRRPKFTFKKRKKTSILGEMEDILNFSKMEDNIKYFCKLNFLKMEDSLIFFENGRKPQFLVNQKQCNLKHLKSKQWLWHCSG